MTPTELQNQFPEFFGETTFDVGFGPGWYPILVRLFTKISVLLNRDGKALGSFKIDQIKEKFGGLTIYWNLAEECRGIYNSIQDEVWFIEKASFLICEDCGTTVGVETRGPRWVRTLCGECRNKHATRT